MKKKVFNIKYGSCFHFNLNQSLKTSNVGVNNGLFIFLRLEMVKVLAALNLEKGVYFIFNIKTVSKLQLNYL